MTANNNLGRSGFRQPSKNDTIRQMATEMQNLQMAGRVSQMMVQQLIQNNKSMGNDLNRALNLINELQYKILAVQTVSNLDMVALAAVADGLRLKDFNETSDNEDARDGYTAIATVEEDSTVILTSTTAEVDKGIFRSRIKLADCGVPELITALAGKEVGTKVTIKLNAVDHEIELLAVRRPKAQVAEVPQVPQVPQAQVEAQESAQVQ
jgi:hypothetical protein